MLLNLRPYTFASLLFFLAMIPAFSQKRNLRADLDTQQYAPNYSQQAASSRSVPLAFVLSAAIPGTGQIYNKQWIKSGIFLGLEGFVIGTQISYNRTGTRLENELEVRANQLFSAVKYAEWLNSYTGNKGARITITEAARKINFANSANWSATEKAEVRTLFDAIRAAEEKSVHLKTDAAFSHKLPYFGEQQYYELMGKYFQYAPGWSDYNGANDPEAEDASGKKINASPYFLKHATDQAEAQSYLRKASRLSTALIFNHVLAAFDAALSAKLHNNRLQTGLAIGTDADGNWMPLAGIAWKF